MTYSEKLRHPLWQKKRLKILERDKWKCRCCGSDSRNLQVHHLVYCKGNNPWDYADDCLKTLCDECHQVHQEIMDRATNAIRMGMMDLDPVQMEKSAQSIINLTFGSDSLKYSLVSTVCDAYDRSVSGCALDMGLWTDLVMDCANVQLFHEKSVGERAIGVMKKAIARLESTHGIKG